VRKPRGTLIDLCRLVTKYYPNFLASSHACLFCLTTLSYNTHNSVLKMPGATFVSEGSASPDANVARTRLDKPLSYSGLLDSYTHSDLTTVIGTEYEGLQVVDLLSAKNSDALIRDLAVTISRRGVVFLRNQDVTPQQMRELMEKITELAGSVCYSSASDLDVADFSSHSPNRLAYTSTHSPRKEANLATRSV
jgi:hypothetical protein